jgi:hypothetical protein
MISKSLSVESQADSSSMSGTTFTKTNWPSRQYSCHDCSCNLITRLWVLLKYCFSTKYMMVPLKL